MVTTASNPSAARTGASGFEFVSLSTLVGAAGEFLSTLPAGRRIAACQLLQSTCEAIKTEAAAEFIPSNGDTRAARRALSDRKVAKSVARKTAARAAAAAKNPTITDKMKSGELSGRQADAIIAANSRTDGAASSDDSLIDQVAAAPVDQTNKIIDRYIADKATRDSVEKEHQRQRALRDVRKIRTGVGLAALMIEGDDASIDAMHKQLIADADHLYRRDGGRDVPNSKHARTYGNRLFDAAHARIAGGAGCSEPESAAAAVVRSPSSGQTSRRHTSRASRRPTVVITVDAAKFTGEDVDALAQQVGVGPIPDSVLARHLAKADLVGAVFRGPGQPLWIGRRSRHASGAQFLALVVRDRGCVQCGASYQRCQAHHLIPWNAPAQGQTDIDKLALLCSDCHHRLHEQNLTLYHDRNTHTWETRAATAAETPPPRPRSTPAETPHYCDLE